MHRLVAEAFLPRPETPSMIKHVNGDRTDNRAENLKWIPRRTRSERRKSAQAPDKSRCVVRGEKDGEVRWWKNGGDCARQLERTPSLIYNALAGRCSVVRCAGWTLRWVDLDELELKEK